MTTPGSDEVIRRRRRYLSDAMQAIALLTALLTVLAACGEPAAPPPAEHHVPTIAGVIERVLPLEAGAEEATLESGEILAVEPTQLVTGATPEEGSLLLAGDTESGRWVLMVPEVAGAHSLFGTGFDLGDRVVFQPSDQRGRPDFWLSLAKAETYTAPDYELQTRRFTSATGQFLLDSRGVVMQYRP
jgi:hypothetical protein